GHLGAEGPLAAYGRQRLVMHRDEPRWRRLPVLVLPASSLPALRGGRRGEQPEDGENETVDAGAHGPPVAAAAPDMDCRPSHRPPPAASRGRPAPSASRPAVRLYGSVPLRGHRRVAGPRPLVATGVALAGVLRRTVAEEPEQAHRDGRRLPHVSLVDLHAVPGVERAAES